MTEYILVHQDWVEETVDTLPKEGYTFYDWKYYNYDHPDVFRCMSCDRFLHLNLLYHWECCLRCCHESEWRKDVIYCPNCKHIHIKWDVCDNWLRSVDHIDDMSVNFWNITNVNTVDYSFHSRWDCERWDLVKKIWQYQSERDLPSDIKTALENFYCGRYKFNHYYYRWDYKIEWDITYMNMTKYRMILDYFLDMSVGWNDNVLKWKKVSPYRNYFFRWITSDWLIERAKYDLMWKEKHWTEKPNTFLQNIWKEIDNIDNSMSLHYVLSSDLEHKLLAFQSNHRFGSCQKKENRESYAMWAYDAVTNGCNCPILIYKNWESKPMWRITCRIMYDESGKEYLLLERLYHDWTLGDCNIRWKMYAQIAHDLKCKWYNVIASNYSAHDKSTYSYLAKFGLSSKQKVNNLCQPLRQLKNWFGYYCDGWTKVLHDELDGIDWATDYLNEWYLI